MRFVKSLSVILCLMFLFSLNSFAKKKVNVSGKLNINTATVAQLSNLPGIGKSKAKAIVKTRKNGKFKVSADLLKVKGISKKLLAKFQNFVKFSGSSDFKVEKKKAKKRGRKKKRS